MPFRALIPILSLGVFLPAVGVSQTGTQKTVWDGIFSQAEAERGGAAYQSHCRSCHGEGLEGFRGILLGEQFQNRWREDNLNSLFHLMEATMPPGNRERPTERQYVDILAYILKMNDYPAGSNELMPAELDKIRIVGKEGPRPVPDFSLITVSGCLMQDEAKRWMLTNASEPIRTHNPRKSSEAESAAAAARTGGGHTFHFLDTYEFAEEFKAGRWTEAKGFLIRAPGSDRINLSRLQGLRETCDARP